VQNYGAVITTFGIAVLVVALLWAHLTSEEVHPVRDPVSKYGITETRKLYMTAGFTAAIAAIGAIIVLTNIAGDAALLTNIFLAIFAVSRAVIPFVPMDEQDAAKTARGRAHNILAFAAFASVTVAGFLAGGVLHNAGLPEQATWSTVFAVVMALGSIGVLLSPAVPALARVFGLVERLIYVGFIGFFITIVFAALA
jgi:Protein of unknown function (DUF998)